MKCSQLKSFLLILLSSELGQLVPLSYSLGRSSRYFDRLYDFFITILRFYSYTQMEYMSDLIKQCRVYAPFKFHAFFIRVGLCGSKSVCEPSGLFLHRLRVLRV